MGIEGNWRVHTSSKRAAPGEVPGGSVVRTWHFHAGGQGGWVQSRVGELRSHKPCSTAKKEGRGAVTTQLQLMRIMGECWPIAVTASDSIKEAKARS